MARKTVLEIASYCKQHRQEWVKSWGVHGIDTIELKNIKFGDVIDDETQTCRPIYFIEKDTSDTEIVDIFNFYFNVPKRVMNLFKMAKLIRMFLPFFNSIILQHQIRQIESTVSINAILVHYSHGLYCPFFMNKEKSFHYIHTCLGDTGWSKTKIRRAYTKLVLRGKKLIGCSYASYEDLQALNLNAKSIDWVLNGVATQNIEKQMVQPLPKHYQNMDYIVFVGRFSPEKQIYKMIEAYVKTDMSVKFVIIAGNENANEKQKAQDAIDRFNLQDNVIMYGRDENPMRWLKNAKFSILYSVFEGSGRVIPESLCTGTPVIVGDKGGCYEYLEGTPLQEFIVDVHDTDVLANAMQMMIDNPVKVPPSLRKKYDYTHHVDGLVSILKNHKLL